MCIDSKVGMYEIFRGNGYYKKIIEGFDGLFFLGNKKYGNSFNIFDIFYWLWLFN